MISVFSVCLIYLRNLEYQRKGIKLCIQNVKSRGGYRLLSWNGATTFYKWQYNCDHFPWVHFFRKLQTIINKNYLRLINRTPFTVENWGVVVRFPGGWRNHIKKRNFHALRDRTNTISGRTHLRSTHEHKKNSKLSKTKEKMHTDI